MKSLTDENFRELFRPVVHGSGFITDASRRQEIAMLKKQNFLAFNPLQLNIYYVVATSVVFLLSIAALISNNVSEENNTKASKPDFHTLKHEVPAPTHAVAPAKPVAVDSAIKKPSDSVASVAAKPAAPKPDSSTSKAPVRLSAAVSDAKKLLADLKFASEGLPNLFAIPQVMQEETKVLLPKMPDSLPPVRKPVVRKPKPRQTVSATDTGRSSAPAHKADSSPASSPAVPAEPATPAQN
jgi:hypothetical protein